MRHAKKTERRATAAADGARPARFSVEDLRNPATVRLLPQAPPDFDELLAKLDHID